jgi:hypothetical protein
VIFKTIIARLSFEVKHLAGIQFKEVLGARNDYWLSVPRRGIQLMYHPTRNLNNNWRRPHNYNIALDVTEICGPRSMPFLGIVYDGPKKRQLAD